MLFRGDVAAMLNGLALCLEFAYSSSAAGATMSSLSTYPGALLADGLEASHNISNAVGSYQSVQDPAP